MRHSLSGVSVCVVVLVFLWLTGMEMGCDLREDSQCSQSRETRAGNLYAEYDRNFSSWLETLKDSMTDGTSLQVALFIQTEVGTGYEELAVYSSDMGENVELLRSVFDESTRIRWPLEGDKETRVSLEKLAAGRITIFMGHSRFDIHLSLSGFQERTSGFYLEFANRGLKEWIDSKVTDWCKINPGHSAYDVETGKLMPLFEWYNFNTRYHQRDPVH